MKNIHMNALLKFIVTGAAVCCLASCGPVKDVTYFQDTEGNTSMKVVTPGPVTIEPLDKISIIVNSKDPELAMIFNLPVVSHGVSNYTGSFSGATANQVSAFTVDAEGFIDFPVLGKLKVSGLRRDEIAQMIKDKIINENYIKDPVVIVEFADMFVSVLGDVSKPGRVSFDKDRITILDAISKAGDLNITAKRTNVKVFREENGRQKCYVTDLTKANDVFTSPVYYLRQEDIVYVEPNAKKMRESTVNGNNLVSVSFWISVSSLFLTTANFIINLSK